MTSEANNSMDDPDFETRMYQYLDPPRSPGIVPSPESRRMGVDDDVAPLTASDFNLGDARFFADEDLVDDEMTNADGSAVAEKSKWFCVQCNRSFAAQFALDQHRRFKHQGYKIHCRHCPHTTTNGYALFLHVQREHGDVNPVANGCTTVNGVRGTSAARRATSVHRKRRAYKVARHGVSARRGGPVNNNYRPHGRALMAQDAVLALTTSVPRRGGGGGHRGGRHSSTSAIGGGKDSAMKIVRQAGMPPLDCDKCGKKFAFSSGLRMHTKMVHSGYRFTCQYCGLHFTNGYAIHRHVNIVHNVTGLELAKNGEDGVMNVNSSRESQLTELSLKREESADPLRLKLTRRSTNDDRLEYSNEINRNELADPKRYNGAGCSATITATPFAVEPLTFANSNNSSRPGLAQQHRKPTLITCLSCPYKTENFDLLKLHFAKHFAAYGKNGAEEERGAVVGLPVPANRNYSFVKQQCPYCTYVAESVSAYVVHAASHFSSSSNLHIAKSSAAPPKKAGSRSDSSLRCTFCERQFPSADEVVHHESNHGAKF